MSENQGVSDGQQIRRLYAWVGKRGDGSEAIVACCASNGMITSMVGADRDVIESFRDNVVKLAADLNITVRLKVFGSGIVVDQVDPPTGRGPFW